MHKYRPERATVVRTTSVPAIKLTITTLEYKIVECERFHPWPALADSWREDITNMQARLKDPQSK